MKSSATYGYLCGNELGSFKLGTYREGLGWQRVEEVEQGVREAVVVGEE